MKKQDPNLTLSGRHRAKILYLNGGQKTLIDRDIAPLIKRLNEIGIATTCSCQATCNRICGRKHKFLRIKRERVRLRNGKYRTYNWAICHEPKMCRESIWIVFNTSNDADRFLNLVYRDTDPKKLQDHMQGYGVKQSYRWNWAMKPRLHTKQLEAYKNHKSKFIFSMQLAFPRAHLALVTERVLA